MLYKAYVLSNSEECEFMKVFNQAVYEGTEPLKWPPVKIFDF